MRLAEASGDLRWEARHVGMGVSYEVHVKRQTRRVSEASLPEAAHHLLTLGYAMTVRYRLMIRQATTYTNARGL